MTRDDRKPEYNLVVCDKTASVCPANIRFARSATKHRVSKESIRHVIAHCGVRFEQLPPDGDSAVADPRLVFLGDDADGRPLEVMAVETIDGELLACALQGVIHAMSLRDKYRAQYEEAGKWRV
jgi:hypothetical protein